MTDIAGRYKAYGIEGSEQYGEAGNQNTLQIMINLDIQDVGVRAAFLYFSEGAAPHSFERLRSLGWSGNSITDLSGIGKNEVDVDIKNETYDGKVRSKVEIVGAGMVMAKPLDKNVFAQRLAAIMGTKAPANAQSSVKPPF